MQDNPPPKKNLRVERREATAQAVLEAARQEFERVGYEAANLRTIAANAGVSAATVIHHHGDKRDLLHAALFDDLEQTLSAALASTPDAPLAAQLDALTRAVFAYYTRRPALSRALLRESLFADEPWASRFTAQTRQVHAHIAALFERARAAGALERDADAALFGVAYLSFFYFALISWAQGAHQDPAALVARLIAQHLDGLSSPQKHEQKT